MAYILKKRIIGSFVSGAVVMVKWSAGSPSIPAIKVQILLEFNLFIAKFGGSVRPNFLFELDFKKKEKYFFCLICKEVLSYHHLTTPRTSVIKCRNKV